MPTLLTVCLRASNAAPSTNRKRRAAAPLWLCFERSDQQTVGIGYQNVIPVVLWLHIWAWSPWSSVCAYLPIVTSIHCHFTYCRALYGLVTTFSLQSLLILFALWNHSVTASTISICTGPCIKPGCTKQAWHPAITPLFKSCFAVSGIILVIGRALWIQHSPVNGVELSVLFHVGYAI